MNSKDVITYAESWSKNENVKDTQGGYILKYLLNIIAKSKKPKSIYVLTTFENPSWGQRSPDNKLQYNSTIVLKTENNCNKVINSYLNKEGLKLTKNEEYFNNGYRAIKVKIVVIK